MPTTNVSATNSPATNFSRRAHLTILLTGSSISATPMFSPPPRRSGSQGFLHTHTLIHGRQSISHQPWLTRTAPIAKIITPATSGSCPTQALRRKTHWPYGRGGFGGYLTYFLPVLDAPPRQIVVTRFCALETVLTICHFPAINIRCRLLRRNVAI